MGFQWDNGSVSGTDGVEKAMAWAGEGMVAEEEEETWGRKGCQLRLQMLFVRLQTALQSESNRSDGDCGPPAKKFHSEIMIMAIKDFHRSYTGSGIHTLVQSIWGKQPKGSRTLCSPFRLSTQHDIRGSKPSSTAKRFLLLTYITPSRYIWLAKNDFFFWWPWEKREALIPTWVVPPLSLPLTQWMSS